MQSQLFNSRAIVKEQSGATISQPLPKEPEELYLWKPTEPSKAAGYIECLKSHVWFLYYGLRNTDHKYN